MLSSTFTYLSAQQAHPSVKSVQTPPGRTHYKTSACRRADSTRRASSTAAAVRGTERTLATVLFADIRGSMALSGSVGVEDWWSMIATLFELMSDAVHRAGGWVGAFTGDGIKGVFEADGRDDDHAHRACQAALSMREGMKQPAAELRRERQLELSVRIGINTGEIVTGTLGDGYGRYHTACGYTVALANRMEALATPDGIYLSEHTAALIGYALKLDHLGRFEVKGASCPVGVYELAPTSSPALAA